MSYSFGLIKESFQILFKNIVYLLKFWLFRVCILIPLLIPLGIGVLFSGLVFSWPLVVGGIVTLILTVVYGVWFSASTFVVTKSMVDNEIVPIKTLAQNSWYQMGKILWTSFLSGLIIALGIILLVVPGVIFAFWFYFAIQVALYENLSGKAALSRSKALVKGHFWWLVKNLAIWFGISLLVSLVLGVGLSFTPISENVQKIILYPINFVEAAISLIYSFLLYRDLVKSSR